MTTRWSIVALLTLAACSPRPEAEGGAESAAGQSVTATSRTAAPAAESSRASTHEGATSSAQRPASNVERPTSNVERPAPSVDPPAPGNAVLTAVRVARQSGFERIVFEFSGRVPRHTVRWEASPAQCGSGDPVTPVGGTALVVQFSGADAHRFEGERASSTIADRDRRPGLPLVKQLRQICDFEAEVMWMIGLPARREYRVSTLAAPPRVVVDVY